MTTKPAPLSLDLRMTCWVKAGTTTLAETRDLYDCHDVLTAYQRARAIYKTSLERCQIMALDGTTIATY
jgi:hypothetical protein